jgi:hypothetical protein
MTAAEIQRMHGLMRLWSIVAFVALAVSVVTPHGHILTDPFYTFLFLQLGRMLIAVALFNGVLMVWRLWRCSRRRQVWVFEGELREAPTGWFSRRLRGFSVGALCRIEAWAVGGILTRDGGPVPLFGRIKIIPERVTVEAVCAGDTDFVGERPMSPWERWELGRDLAEMWPYFAFRPVICVFVAGWVFSLTDRLIEPLATVGPWGTKFALALRALFWLRDLWRLLLITADLARGRCRRREGWDLVTLPWSKTPWSKEGRPAEWRLGRRPITEVPPKARVSRIQA